MLQNRLFCVSTILLVMVLSVQFAYGVQGTVQRKSSLPPVKVRILNTKLLPALAASNQEESFLLISELLATSSPEQVKLIDDFVTSYQFAKATEIYSKEVVTQIRNGTFQGGTTLVQLGIIESRLNQEIDDKIKTIEAEQQVMATNDLPTVWTESVDFFWRFHVLQNELESARKLSSYSDGIQTYLSPGKTSVNQNSEKLRVARLRLMKNEARYRTKQIENASNALADAAEFDTQFEALLQLHSAKLFFDDFFERKAGGFADPTSAVEFKQLVDEKIAAVQVGREAIAQKVVLFRTGLHWWFRGRYGAAELAGGLMKPASAKNNPQAMFGLQMPRKRPEPKSVISLPTATQVPEYFERRHHYNWKVGHRERFGTGASNVLLIQKTNRFY